MLSLHLSVLLFDDWSVEYVASNHQEWPHIWKGIELAAEIFILRKDRPTLECYYLKFNFQWITFLNRATVHEMVSYI